MGKSPRSDSTASSTRVGSSSTVTSSSEAYDEALQEALYLSQVRDQMVGQPTKRSPQKNNNIDLIETELPCRRELELESGPSRQSTKLEILDARAPAVGPA